MDQVGRQLAAACRDRLHAQIIQLAEHCGGALLAIETSTMQGSVALADPLTRSVHSILTPARAQSSEHLVVSIAAACAALDLAPRDLRGIAVGHGPGSFTGLRVGLATAHGLCLGSGCRLVGVSSLASLALSAYVQKGGSGPIVTLVDARCGEIYVAAYTHRQTAGHIEQTAVLADRAVSVEGLPEALQVLRDVPNLRCVGDYAMRFVDTQALPACVLPPVHADAAVCLALAAAPLQAPRPPHTAPWVLPQYLQVCTAERRLGALRA